MSKLTELRKDLAEARSAAADAQATCDALEQQIRVEANREAFNKDLSTAAAQLHDVYQIFKEAGFSDKQAFSLVNTLLQCALLGAPRGAHSIKAVSADELMRLLEA